MTCFFGSGSVITFVFGSGSVMTCVWLLNCIDRVSEKHVLSSTVGLTCLFEKRVKACNCLCVVPSLEILFHFQYFLKWCFTSPETIRSTRDGEPRIPTSIFTQLLGSELSGPKQGFLCYANQITSTQRNFRYTCVANGNLSGITLQLHLCYISSVSVWASSTLHSKQTITIRIRHPYLCHP